MNTTEALTVIRIIARSYLTNGNEMQSLDLEIECDKTQLFGAERIIILLTLLEGKGKS